MGLTVRPVQGGRRSVGEPARRRREVGLRALGGLRSVPPTKRRSRGAGRAGGPGRRGWCWSAVHLSGFEFRCPERVPGLRVPGLRRAAETAHRGQLSGQRQPGYHLEVGTSTNTSRPTVSVLQIVEILIVFSGCSRERYRAPCGPCQHCERSCSPLELQCFRVQLFKP